MTNTGWIASPLDTRDFLLSDIQPPVDLPEVFMPDYSFLPTYHQHKQPACVGHAVTWMQNYYDWAENQGINTLSPRYIYALCKKNDGMYDYDGTSYRVGLKMAKDYGNPEDLLFPNNTDLDRATYIDTKQITPETYDEAEVRRIKAYASGAKTFDAIKQAIYQNKVILIAMQVDENMYTDRFGNVSWQEKDILPLRLPVPSAGGHAVVGIGYDKDRIYFKNSWGTDWGSNKQAAGVGYFTKGYIPYIKEIWTAVDLPNDKIQELKDAQKTLIGLLNRMVIYLKEQLKAKGATVSAFFRG